jgi:hypothetical protein
VRQKKTRSPKADLTKLLKMRRATQVHHEYARPSKRANVSHVRLSVRQQNLDFREGVSLTQLAASSDVTTAHPPSAAPWCARTWQAALSRVHRATHDEARADDPATPLRLIACRMGQGLRANMPKVSATVLWYTFVHFSRNHSPGFRVSMGI